MEVLKLLKAVYGLRDAPRAWRLRLKMELVKLGGKPLIMDRSLFYHLAFKSVLAVVYLIITLALNGQRKDLIMKNPQLLGNMQKLDGVINSLFVFWVFLVRI